MTHGTGHGIGLDVHEPPLLDPKGGELLAGDVVTIEPGLYKMGLGGVRLEDMVVVTAEGSENLNRLPEKDRVKFAMERGDSGLLEYRNVQAIADMPFHRGCSYCAMLRGDQVLELGCTFLYMSQEAGMWSMAEIEKNLQGVIDHLLLTYPSLAPINKEGSE